MTLVLPTAASRHPSRGARAGLIRRLFNAVVRSIAITHNRRFLQAMPDYMLKDIGINRSEIDSFVVSIVDEIPDPTRRSRGRF